MPADAFSVRATKKGGIPLSLGKRKFGKVVTRVDNVRGAPLLLSKLKAALGAGGAVSHDGAVEIQGDHREALTAWLLNSGCMVGAAKPKPIEPLAEEIPEERPQRLKPRWDKTKSSSLADPTSNAPDALADAAVAAAVAAGCPQQAGLEKKAASTEYINWVLLMKSWQYWDHDYSTLPERWDRHRLAQRQGSELEETHREARGTSAAPQTADARDEALRELGMVAEACPSRQNRRERLIAQKANAKQPAHPVRDQSHGSAAAFQQYGVATACRHLRVRDASLRGPARRGRNRLSSAAKQNTTSFKHENNQ